MPLPNVANSVVKRLPFLKQTRSRAVAISVCCFLLVLLVRFLYNYIHTWRSTKDGRRLTSRSGSSRASKDKKKHGSGSSGNGSSHSHNHAKSSSSLAKKKTDPTLPTLLMLVGIHGSGKSFWASRYVTIVHKSYVIISSDSIRSRLTGTIEDYSHEDEVEVELLRELQQTLELHRSCILDDCQHNLSAQFRAKVKAVAAQKANCVVKLFSVKPSYAMARIQGAVEEGMVRYKPTIMELEKQVEELAAFEKTYKDDGWIEN
ncbi:hypothetical protein ABB37_03472 [Leptomonas pyrrhocoris]|uniref:Uncharacterized protein n=1 Tax=Leptomonas pyrrhocoris TaxID=157538 RepID=A0A0N0DWZ4_LEPPY|nr:hypothetical protein ABB37_03472 [Leptomonas pyrrhocoris]KPA82395.1 hypothetical protein ABB37_03472 [Leptomonas pyrrhocoris]|eukprot:XP_015660834.1 hypothetical protein ABB37_03472 [Leptomonas pyrrhocoris]